MYLLKLNYLYMSKIIECEITTATTIQVQKKQRYLEKESIQNKIIDIY